TTVVVSNAGELGPSTLDRLRSHARAAGTVVLVDPGSAVLDGYHLTATYVDAGSFPGGCDSPLFRGLAADVPATRAVKEPGCLRGQGGSLLASTGSDPETWVLTAPQVLRNGTVLDGDNAAIALRLLGQGDRVLWYVADATDTTAADAVSIRSFLPRWLVPGVWLAALALLGYLLVRARRLGPLVPEPLPVVVRAVETTESRGRLYRRTRDRQHAAVMLRRGTRRRLATRLAVSAHAGLDVLAPVVATASGRDVLEVTALLDDLPVHDDSALAVLGRDLRQLEAEVAHP
ncbi:MAG: secreted protein, partial [Nocardioidaceae bacterium]|nr:secreted protein [Nocardioidaceae bacterium]